MCRQSRVLVFGCLTAFRVWGGVMGGGFSGGCQRLLGNVEWLSLRWLLATYSAWM